MAHDVNQTDSLFGIWDPPSPLCLPWKQKPCAIATEQGTLQPLSKKERVKRQAMSIPQALFKKKGNNPQTAIHSSSPNGEGGKKDLQHTAMHPILRH